MTAHEFFDSIGGDKRLHCEKEVKTACYIDFGDKFTHCPFCGRSLMCQHEHKSFYDKRKGTVFKCVLICDDCGERL